MWRIGQALQMGSNRCTISGRGFTERGILMAGKILIVDDEPTNVDQIKALLIAAGYEVVTATDGEQGWTVFNQDAPSAVVSGMRMPNLDGMALLKRIRNRTKDVPMVIMLDPGEDSSDDAAEAQM